MDIILAVLLIVGVIVIMILPFLVLRWLLPSLGEAGEKRVARRLKKLPEDQYTVLNDVTLPTANGGTSQIDHIVVSLYGIFVIETKNYSGWILGGEDSENWTSRNRYGEKYQFYNPLLQNTSHVRALRSILSQFKYIRYFPIVVFTESATLKLGKSIQNVVYSKSVVPLIKQHSTIILTKEQVTEIAQTISAKKLSSRKIKRAHISNVKDSKKKKQQKIDSGICPRCGGHLVIREWQHRKFYGCSNYPRCKFTTNL